MKRTASSLKGLWPYAVLGLIVLAGVLGNLYWLQQNVVQLGHDASAHLSRTLKMAEEMSPLSLGSFLRGLTITEFRPPGLYLAVQPFYLLFGRSIDTAQLANVFLHALTVVCTFFLARRVLKGVQGAAPLALLAAAITTLLPMLLAMSRLFYTEALVTLCVVTGVIFLLRGEGFSRRAWSAALGVVLGVGLLAKWTLPLYLGVPLLLVAWQSSIRTAVQRGAWSSLFRPSGPRAAGSATAGRAFLLRALVAVAAAAAVALILYWPQRDLWAQTLLGPWLALAWFAIWLALFGLLLAPSTPLLNLLLALVIGGAIAALWYLPRAGFAVELSDVAFGTGGGDFRPADWTSFNQYFRYFRLFFQHHLGLLISLLILPAGLLPWLWHGRTWLRTLPGALLVCVTTLSPFLLLIATSQTNSRNLVPVLPLFAIVVTIGLLAYAVRWRIVLAAVWLGALLVFWGVVTFDGLGEFQVQTRVLWPAQGYSVAPARGDADPAYWIVPDVLATVAPRAPHTTTLGIMLETTPLHPGSFEYDILHDQLPVDLISLTSPSVLRAGDVIASQWVLFKDGNNRDLLPSQQELVQQIQDGAPWFSRLFSLVKTYPFPNGDHAYLYRRSAGPPDPYLFSTIIGADLPPVADAVRRWWTPSAVLAFGTPETAVWLGTQDVPLTDAVIPPGGADLQPADLTGVQRTLIVVSRYHTLEFQEWLGREFRYIGEVQGGEFTATLYGRVDRPLEEIAVATSAAWPALQVEVLATWPTVAAGDPLPVDVTLDGQLDGTWKVSARLVDQAGAPIWQQDTTALPGRLPLTLFVPPGTPPGAYSLQFVVYNAATQEAVSDAAGRPATPLATIEVVE